MLCAVSWRHVFTLYREHRADFILQLESTARELALPYHLARMRMREPVEALPVPVYGVSLDDVNDTWGAARAEGRTHEGVDIFSQRGTPVFSATEGYVVRLNIGTRGGRNVMVYGPGGMRYYYAHLSRIARGVEPGMRVTPDSVLGFVGNSGNASSTPPHLHFGIYPPNLPRRWDAVNPYPFLAERRSEE